MQSYLNIEEFEYELLNKDNVHIKWLDKVESANVVYSSENELKQKATIDMTLDMAEEIDINSRIRIYHVLNGIKNPIGTFLISIPSEDRNSMNKEVSLECHSLLWLLFADKVTTRYTISLGTNVVAEVKRILTNMNFTFDILDSTKTTSVHQEWEIGTSYLKIINDLLSSINYTTLYVDAYGKFLAIPYVFGIDREIEFTYDETDINNRLESDNSYELNLFNVHNIFVKYVNNPNVKLYAKYENNNPQSETSTINRPPNPIAEEVRDVSDLQTLFDLCKKECSEETNRYAKCEISTAINPQHLFSNCLYVNLNGVTGKFVEYEWKIECETGGSMSHLLKKVVVV